MSRKYTLGGASVRKPRQLTTKELHASVDRWNANHAVGDAVRFRQDDGTTLCTKTRSRAELLSGHTPVVWLDGVSGCVLLSRVWA